MVRCEQTPRGRTWRLLALLVGVVASSTARAQQGAPTGLAGPSHGERNVRSVQSSLSLEDLAFLAGHCWTGTFPDSSATDTHCYRWQFGRAFLRDSHEVVGKGKPYHGETIYRTDRTRGDVSFWYFNSDGDVTTGRGKREGGEIVFPEVVEGANGRRELKTVWRREASAYEVVVSERRGAQWFELWRMRLRRK